MYQKTLAYQLHAGNEIKVDAPGRLPAGMTLDDFGFGLLRSDGRTPRPAFDWLRELLFLFSAQGFVTGRAEVLEIETGRLTAVLHGETYDPARHGLKLEVKTPTYHEYRLEETAGGWQATILLDV
uniref:Archease n=1 Tax=candidate division WOR-3 bacterium TaxID=2052148 RepID=A0A7C4GEJ7_UNCW3